MAWTDIIAEIAKVETSVVACEAAVPVADAITKEVAATDRIAIADYTGLNAKISSLVTRLQELKALSDEQRELTKSESDQVEIARIQAAKDCVTTQERDHDGNVTAITHESKVLGKRASRSWTYAIVGAALTASGGAIEIKDIA